MLEETDTNSYSPILKRLQEHKKKSKAKGSWMQKAMDRPGAKGALHRNLGVPAGKKIGHAKIAAATNSSNPRIRKEAQMAENMGA